MKESVFERLILPFITGGVIISGTTLLAEDFGPRSSVIFWSLPFSLLPTLLILHWRGAGDEQALNILRNVFPAFVPLLSFSIGAYYGIKKYNSLLSAIFCGCLTWVVGAGLVIAYWKLSDGNLSVS